LPGWDKVVGVAVCLLETADMPQVPGTNVPESLYLVTRDPSPLAGMEYPRWEGLSWKALAGLGLVHVVCLAEGACEYDPSPLRRITGPRLQDMAGGAPPDNPALEEEKVRPAALDVLALLRAGEGVVVHCEGGTGRMGTVLGCVLRGLGYRSEEVATYLDRLTKARGRNMWPESEWQAAVVRGFVV
jgi:Swiss Army Knife protein, DSP-PTPase phosphatase domain